MNLQTKPILLVIIQEFTEKNIAAGAVDKNGEKNNLRKGFYFLLFFISIKFKWRNVLIIRSSNTKNESKS